MNLSELLTNFFAELSEALTYVFYVVQHFLTAIGL